MHDEDELLDLVDRNDDKVGTILRSKTNNRRNLEGHFLRASEAFLCNSRDQLWIPRRHMNKRIAPGSLDYSMAEHVKADENYVEGCLRGFGEELNLSLKESDLLLVHKFPPSGDLMYFRTLYMYKSDKTPPYNPSDFSDAMWITPEKLLKILEDGEPAKSSLQESIEYLIEHKSEIF